MGCFFCGGADSSCEKYPEGKDIFRLQCEKCGTVDFSEHVDTSKLGTLTADDRASWAEYFRENKGKVPLIDFGNFDSIQERLRDKRDAEKLRAELQKKRG
jgi:hypothetical protein